MGQLLNIASKAPFARLGKDRRGRNVFRKGANHSFEMKLWDPYVKYLNMLVWQDEPCEGKEEGCLLWNGSLTSNSLQVVG